METNCTPTMSGQAVCCAAKRTHLNVVLINIIQSTGL